jgi:deoxyinosine 3'endonuclease (endonuclease V)
MRVPPAGATNPVAARRDEIDTAGMTAARTFGDLVAEGAAVPVDGWDFSWFAGRATEERPPWGYARMMAGRMACADAVLDVQTGGGEVLATVRRPPPTLAATESWPPNVAKAHTTLRPLGASVVGAADDGPLPFRSGSFDLVVSRHPVVTVWPEVARVLRPGGVYLSQQIGAGTNRELTDAVMGPQPVSDARRPERAVAAAESAGLVVDDLREATLGVEFFDVAAVVHFLRKVLWTRPGLHRRPLPREPRPPARADPRRGIVRLAFPALPDRGAPAVTTVEEAEKIQRDLAALVEIPAGPVPAPRTVAALDVSYEVGGDRLVAAAVVVAADGTVLEERTVAGRADFPYVPGLLAFREVPVLLEVLRLVVTPVDLLLCDGQGYAHPRRCGSACHVGVLTGMPSVGCAKNHFVGEHAEPGPERGDRAPLVDAGKVVGAVLRTQCAVRPVYVSPGHRIGVEQATDLVLALTSRFRLPDGLRRADHISRQALREL